ncbi:putative integral membrane protein [Acanthocheilonema viteae]
MVIENGTLYQTCICCGQLCGEEIQQADSKDIKMMLANVNSFWIITDISMWSIIFILLIIFANFCIFIITFDDLTYLCIIIWAYLSNLHDFHFKIPQRCKLKSMEQFLEKHKLSDYCTSRNLFIFMRTCPKPFFNSKNAREARHLAHFKQDYQNTQTQAKNALFIHYLIKKIIGTHSVRIRLDDLRLMEFELLTQ